MIAYKYLNERYSFITTIRQSKASYKPIKLKVPKPIIYKKIRPFRIIKTPKQTLKIYSRLIPSKAKVKTFKPKPI